MEHVALRAIDLFAGAAMAGCAMRAVTVPLSMLPYRRPCVPGLERGVIVTGVPHGRRFRVLATDEWVVTGGWDFDAPDRADLALATGPYAALQALDDPGCTVIWPRDWYVVPGQQLELLEAA